MPTFCPWSRSIAADLQALGHEVHIFDFIRSTERGLASRQIHGIDSDSRELMRKMASVHLMGRLPYDRLQYAIRSVQLGRMAHAIGADIVLTLSGAGYYLMAYLSGFRPYAAYVVGSDVLLAGPVLKLINRIALIKAAVVFANGGYLSDRTRVQIPGIRIIPLLIGIDLEKYTIAKPDPLPIQMICTRGFEDVYNNESIIRGLASLPKDMPEYRMVFVSGGHRLKRCEDIADALLPPHIRSRVHFLGGVSDHILLEELHRSHVFVSMSRSDGTATSLLEGLACGLYPILSDIPQNREWVDHESENGILVTLDDDKGLTNAMKDAILHKTARPDIADHNRRIVADRANARTNRRKMIEHLEQVVERPCP